MIYDENLIEEIKKTRLEYGVSQNKLAVSVGISRQYLNEIENGKKLLSENLKEKLLFALELYNPDNPLELLFDYVRVRFPTDDVKHVIEKILQLKMKHMLHEDWAFYGYSEKYILGDVVIMISPESDKGILLELKGKGCRQFESYLLTQERSWYDFFESCIQEKAVIKRLDLAINDKVGILHIPTLVKKCEQDECVSVFRSFKNYRSGELIRREEKADMGNTLYIGSLKSEVYFCVYEKDYEQYIRNGIPIEETEVKNRFEIRLKNDRAKHAIADLLKYHNEEKTIFDIVNRYVRFVDEEFGKRKSEWRTNAEWEVFLGKNRGELRLTTKPEPYTYEKTWKWLKKQVAPTLKVVTLLDNIKGTEELQKLIQEAELSRKQEKVLEQQKLTTEDVIIPF